MAWKETARAAITMLRRTYKCDAGHQFVHRTADPNEPAPPCPGCPPPIPSAPGPVVAWVPPLPALGTTKGKAIDLAQKIAEEDYGLTDFNDNQRAGDIAYKPPAPMQTAEREAAIREMMQAGVPEALPMEAQQKVQNFWQGSAGATSDTIVGDGSIAKAASQEAAAQGVDPVGILERGRSSGMMGPMPMNVMASCTKEDALQAAGGS
jgi:hypothetical protein